MSNRQAVKDIKLIRELSGAGVQACKKAYYDCGMDIDKAVEQARLAEAPGYVPTTRNYNAK